MSKKEPVSIGDAFQHMFNMPKYKGKFKEFTLVKAWKETMPIYVIKNTKRIFVKDNKLFIELNSAPLKHSLLVNIDKVKQKLVDHSNIIELKTIIFL